MAIETEQQSSLSGLNAGEAKEFNRIFVTSFCVFTAIAIVAHILVWIWRPWLPSAHGYQTSMIDGLRLAQQMITAAV